MAPKNPASVTIVLNVNTDSVIAGKNGNIFQHTKRMLLLFPAIMKSGTPACTEDRGGARFLLRAHYKHFFTKIIKSLERAGGAAAPIAPPQRWRP